MATTENKSAFQVALEAYLNEHGECNAETFQQLQKLYESKEDDAEGEEAEGEAEGEKKGGFDLDKATGEVFDAYKKLSKEQQKAFCNAMRLDEIYFEYKNLSEEDRNIIREAIGESAGSYDVDTFIAIMESAVDAINNVNESDSDETEGGNLHMESNPFDQFDFLNTSIDG